MDFRIGFGFDVHPLKDGHPFFMGGVRLEHTHGAYGHSDADVLIHALCDALLGAANLRDIGHHFSNQDPKYKNISSLLLLGEVTEMLVQKGYRIGNVDCTVCLEDPKINPHIPAMQELLAKAMRVGEEEVSIKATTNEKLGYIGRGEGVTAYAVALIVKADAAHQDY